MKKWAFLFAAASAVIIGCGGSGGSDDGNGAGGGIGGGLTSGAGATTRVSLGESPSGQSASVLYVGFLTGQGRDPGDVRATFTRLALTDEVGRVERDDVAPLNLNLTKYSLQIARVAPITYTSLAPNGRTFQNFTLDPVSVGIEGGGSSTVTNLPMNFSARIQTFPGRDSFLPIYLDDSMFDFTSGITFDADRFRAVNQPATGDPDAVGKIVSILSDYVRFDVTGMPAASRPLLTNGARAEYVYFSGDNQAVSNGSLFETLTDDPADPLEGSVETAPIGNFPGTYDTKQADPTDILGLARIISLYGRWRDYDEVLTGLGTFEFIVFPNSAERYDDAAPADTVAFVRDGDGAVTALYFGESNLNTGTFTLFPVANLVTKSTTGAISGTLTAFVNASGNQTTNEPSVRAGTYAFTGGTLPTGFVNTGRFVVFRK